MDSENGNRRAIPELSLDSQVLMRHLREVEVGETITYAELSQKIKRDVQHEARGNLTTARHRVQSDDGFIFGAITSVGLKRLDDIGILSTGAHDMSRIQRISKRAGTRLAHIDLVSLSDEKQKEYWLRMGGFGVLAHFAKPATQQKLMAGADTKKLMPTTEMLQRIKETL